MSDVSTDDSLWLNPEGRLSEPSHLKYYTLTEIPSDV